VAELGRAMFRKVRRRFLIAEPRNITLIVVDEVALEQVFSQFLQVSLLTIIAPLLHTHHSPPPEDGSEIIISLVFKLGGGASMTRHFADYSERTFLGG
jgi:hypothetical protein